MNTVVSPEGPQLFPYRRADFDRGPYVVFYEVTQACDLVCLHCRACAQAQRHPDELDTQHARLLIDQLLEFPKPPLLVLTGGDPMKRADIFDLVRHAASSGLRVAMTPSATPLVTRPALYRLARKGLSRLAVSLDGADAATHDGIRGVPGSFRRTFEIIADAQAAGLPVQVNTTVTRTNVAQIDALAELLAAHGIVLWSVFFLVPVGRGSLLERISPEQYEQVFDRLREHSLHQPYDIKTTEAPHYRRFVLQHRGTAPRDDESLVRPPRAPPGVNDGKGVMFISHAGLIHPSGFLPLVCGVFPLDSVVDVYQRSPVFRALRDLDRLEGKCRDCEFRQVCGGSRARAYAVTGNPLAAEPDCVYLPASHATQPARREPLVGVQE